MTDGVAPAWLSLQCPHCRARLRLKEAYAHLRGRCPECSYRIEAPRPRPATPQPARLSEDFDDESPRLMPLEEEWPEPASLEGDDAPEGNYALTSMPKRWAESPAPVEPEPPGIEGYEVTDGWTEAPPTPAPELPDAYNVGAVPKALQREEEPVLYRLSRAERQPLREPPPPDHPLLEGVYFFAWQSPANLRVWVLLTLLTACVLVLAMAAWYFCELIMAGDRTGAFAPFPIAALLIVGAVAGAFAGSIFLATVQDTAAGNRDVRWPDEAFFTRFAQFLYLLWLLSCAVWPIGIVLMIQPALLRRLAVAVPLALVPALLFPLFFLSSLSAQKPGALLHGRLLMQLARRFPAALVTFIVSLALTSLCAALGYWNIIKFEFRLTLVTAATWSTALLIYGRLLGRVAWLCARKEAPGKK